MADLETTIALVFEGVDRTGSTISSIGSNLEGLERSVGNVTGPLASLAGSVLRTEAAVIALASAMAGLAINEAGKFGDALTEIGTLFEGTDDQVKGLADEILSYARTSTASIDEINAAIYRSISTGTDYADSVRLVADAEVLATAGRANLADTTALLTSSLNAYGASVTEAADFSDTLFTTVKTGNTTMPELAASLGQITGIASAAGVPFADLNGALAALTISAGSTAESSTLLKGILAELISPSDALKAALGSVSLESDGLAGVMARLQAVTNGDAAAMSELFGNVRALQGALVLANDSSGAFASALDAQAQRAGAAAEANDRLSRSFESTNTNLGNNIRATVIEFGSEMLDTYGEIAEGLGDVFAGLGDGLRDGAFDDLFDAIDAAGADATRLLKGIADALPAALAEVDFGDLLDAFAELGGSISGIFDGLDLTKPEDLTRALQFMVDGFETLTRVSAGIVDGLQPFIQALGTLIEEVNNGETDIKAFAGEMLGLATGINTVLPVLGILGGTLSTVADGFIVLSGARTLGATTAGMAALATRLAGATGVTAALGLAATAGYSFGSAIEDMTGIGSKLGGLLYDLVNDTEDYSTAVTSTATATQAATKASEEYIEGERIKAVANRDANLSFEEQAERAERNAEIMARLANIGADVVDSQDEIADSADRAGRGLDRLTDYERENLSVQEKLELSAQRYAEATDGVVFVNGRLRRETIDLADAKDGATRSTDKQTAAEKKAAEQLERARQAAQDYQLQLARLASDERIKGLEFEFKLDLAELQADADRAVSIIEGIGTTTESTADLLGSLFGQLSDANLSRFDELEISRQIDLENDRRDEALRQQAALVAEQVELLKQQAKLAEARARAVANGEQLIKVEAEGLTPALEIVFDEILKFAQIRASQEGAEFLIGL